MGMLVRGCVRLELLECMPFFAVMFRGMVGSSLVPGAGLGWSGTPGRFLAGDEKPLLRWGAFSIEIDDNVLDFERDWDGREDTVGGTINAT